MSDIRIRGEGALVNAQRADTRKSATKEDDATENKPSFGEVLARVGRQFDRAQVDVQAAKGVEKSPLELLTIQASVYHYTEMLTIGAKLADGIVGAVKTVLNKDGG